MKLRNDWSEFATLIARIAEISDSRYTTQVAVAADCEAALHTRQKRFAAASADCERFMTAIEAANEPPLERWPHFITKFQVLLAAEMPDEAAAFLEELIHLFDGAIRQRTQICILAAHAFAAKWRGSADYAERLRTFMTHLRAANWTAVLINLPDHLAELCADALELGIETDFCTALIRRRALAPPESSPSHWPWPLRLFVLGDFRMELNGAPVNPGAKPPTRSLDILRVLAIAKDHACSLQDIYEWLWPDAEGDQAKAACEQALHRLRKLLSVAGPDRATRRPALPVGAAHVGRSRRLGAQAHARIAHLARSSHAASAGTISAGRCSTPSAPRLGRCPQSSGSAASSSTSPADSPESWNRRATMPARAQCICGPSTGTRRRPSATRD